jgi:precorrin-2 dehydrogenase/sirohydrochlorin ferrochelatase
VYDVIIDLNIAGKLVIVVGAGTEGTRKVKALLGQSCKIIVVSNRLNKFLLDLVKEGKIHIVKATLKNANVLDKFEKPFLVLACTNDRDLNRKMVQKARQIGAFAYAADDPTASDFIHPAVINIGDTVFVTISTKGQSPAMARTLRIRAERVLKRLITKEDVEYVKLAGFARNAAMGSLKNPASRKKYLYAVIKDGRIKNLIKNKKFEDAKSAAMEMLEAWA